MNGKTKLTKEQIRFLEAALQGDTAVIRQLLAKGIGPDIRDDRFIPADVTPLMHAAGRGHLEVVLLLLASGADVNACDRYESESGCTPLHYAAHGKHIEIMEVHLRAGAEINAVGFEEFGTPLQTLLRFNHLTDLTLGDRKEDMIFKAMMILLNAGADPNIPNRAEHTCPLQSAVQEGLTKIVRLLVDKGADVNHRNQKDRTAFDTALHHGREDIALFLLQHGLDIRRKNKDGLTPLMKAVNTQSTAVVEALIQAGADCNAAANDGLTALDLAAERGDEKIVKILTGAGARRRTAAPIRKSPIPAEMRGAFTFNYDGKSIWALADPEAVTDALSRSRKAGTVIKNAANQPVTLTDQCFFIFRLRGHTWTQIVARDQEVVRLIMNQGRDKQDKKELNRKMNQARRRELNEKDAQSLSRQLSTRALFYGISDTACALGYKLYENGTLIEQLETEEGYEIRKWKSATHPQQKKEIGNIEQWVHALFLELDALEPGLSFAYLAGAVCHNEPVDLLAGPDIFERIDFIGL